MTLPPCTVLEIRVDHLTMSDQILWSNTLWPNSHQHILSYLLQGVFSQEIMVIVIICYVHTVMQICKMPNQEKIWIDKCRFWFWWHICILLFLWHFSCQVFVQTLSIWQSLPTTKKWGLRNIIGVSFFPNLI